MSKLANIAEPAMTGYEFTSANEVTLLNVTRPHINAIKARQEFYNVCMQQIFQTNSELLLASDLVSAYSKEDSEYYYQMYCWLNERYGCYVLGNALTFAHCAV